MTSYKEKFRKCRKYLFWLFLIFLAIGWYGKDNFKSATGFTPEEFREPVQSVIKTPTPIKFSKDGFSYTLTPVADYSLSGLVVHKMDYDRWYSLSRTDEVFTVDFCVVWGENLRNGEYKNPTLSIKQDFRFCLYSYSYAKEQRFENSQISNNHLIVEDPLVLKKISAISAGDQVQIIGKLVNVRADALGETRQFEGKEMDWTTSTTRADSGAGACEIIYVEDVVILRKGNIVYHAMFDIGKFGMIAVILSYFCLLGYEVFLDKY